MGQTTTDLRKAGAAARAFADSVGSPELKLSFRDMARRWEAEADQRETEDRRNATLRRIWSSPRKH
jgi:hypothetical protein